MKKKRSIMVLGKGPVLTMTVLFFLLFLVLGAAFLSMRRRDPGTAVTCLIFSLASAAAGVMLLLAFFRHKKEDEELATVWQTLDEKSRKK